MTHHQRLYRTSSVQLLLLGWRTVRQLVWVVLCSRPGATQLVLDSLKTLRLLWRSASIYRLIISRGWRYVFNHVDIAIMYCSLCYQRNVTQYTLRTRMHDSVFIRLLCHLDHFKNLLIDWLEWQWVYYSYVVYVFVLTIATVVFTFLLILVISCVCQLSIKNNDDDNDDESILKEFLKWFNLAKLWGKTWLPQAPCAPEHCSLLKDEDLAWHLTYGGLEL